MKFLELCDLIMEETATPVNIAEQLQKIQHRLVKLSQVQSTSQEARQYFANEVDRYKQFIHNFAEQISNDYHLRRIRNTFNDWFFLSV